MQQAGTTASFGYWVRRRRLSLDITQAALAQKIGCATVTISKIERDERRPSRQMATLLADQLAIPDEERNRFIATAMEEYAVDWMPLTVQPLTPRSNLPVPSTPFVGRHQELEHLVRCLEDPSCRLVTLAGPGGFGKTRLALRLGELVLERKELFQDGVFFVALEGLEGVDLIVPAIATALQFIFHKQQDQDSQLLNYLSGKQLLLILDNAEHLLDHELLENVLGRAPQVKIVVTSRETLNLQQEWFYPVVGMDMGDPEAGSRESSSAAAVQLFQQCAQRSRPGFDLSKELDHVWRICRMVDGAPLAIELAAAWLKALPCDQVAWKLERSFDFLFTSLRNIPARHRSMRVVLEQSWQHLTAEEQRVFCQLSVFVGDFCADAAEKVAGIQLSTLVSLVEKSVLQLTQSGRYRIHELLRQLGAEQLAAQPQELASVQARHCDVYMAFLHDRRHSIVGQDQQQVLREVQEEQDNIRSAWNYATRQGRLEELGRALPCLFHFLWTQGRYEEGEKLIAVVLDQLDTAPLTTEHQAIQIILTARRAQFAAAQGVHQGVLSALEEALTAAVEAEILHGQALCHYVAGTIYFHMRNRDTAIRSLSRAYEIYQYVGDSVGASETSMDLGYAYVYLVGDYKTGQRLVEEGLQLFRNIGAPSMMAEALDRAAAIRWKVGEFQEAEKYYQESLALAEQVGHRHLIASTVGGLGLVAWGRGKWDLAIYLLQERLQKMQDLGHEPEVNTSLFLLCGCFAHAGRYS